MKPAKAPESWRGRLGVVACAPIARLRHAADRGSRHPLARALRLSRVLRARPHKWRFFAAHVLQWLALSRLFRIRRDRFQLRFYPSAMSASLWIDPGERSHDEQVMFRLLRPRDTMVDVGANIGNVALAAAAAVGREGTVYAFEPHPRIFRFLQGNIRLNRRAHVIPIACAVGAEDATITLTDVLSDDMNRISSTAPRGIRVQQVALDSYLADVAGIRVLKVDVEGYELSVFKGASAVLGRTDYVYFESWEKHCTEFGYSCIDVWKLLWQRDFDIWRLRGDRAESLLDVDSQRSHRCENLLAVRRGLPVPR